MLLYVHRDRTACYWTGTSTISSPALISPTSPRSDPATLVMKKARLQALVYDILSCRKAMLGVWKKGSQLLESFNVCSKLLELFITGPQWSQW